jgi:Fe(3+) dicitrate transport protein
VRANNRRYLSRGGEGKLVHSLSGDSWKNRLEAGLRYHEDSEDRHHWDDLYRLTSGQMTLGQAGVAGSQTNALVAARSLASYIQATFEWAGLALTPGLRYEDITYSKSYGIALPGLGVTWAAWDGLTLLAGVHRGFSPGGISVSGTNVNETFNEVSTNYEAGFRASDRAWHAELIGFYNDYENLLGKDTLAGGGAGSVELFNGGKARVQGLELGLGADPAKLLGWGVRIPLSAALTLTEAVFLNSFSTSFADWEPAVSSGDELPYIPKVQASAKAGIEAGPASLGLTLRHVGQLRTTAGQGGPAWAESIPAHWVADLNAGWAYTPGSRFFVNVRNLADTVYLASRRPAGLRPGLPRSFSGGVSLQF